MKIPVEGAVTIGAAVLGWFLMVGFPDQILASSNRHDFSMRNSKFVLAQIERDRKNAQPDKLTWAKTKQHIVNWELWCYGFTFIGCSAPIYAFAYFIQIILGTILDSTAIVSLLCAPPYLVSMIWTWGCAW